MPTAIVTGASRGLGLALARALAERGARSLVIERNALVAGEAENPVDAHAIAFT